jgi:alpha-1,2-mannosyltransferase
MYVIYPMICYNAAHALESTISIVDKFLDGKVNRRLSKVLSRSVWCGPTGLYILLSLARIFAQIRAFRAPMQVYGNLESPSTVCLGKEWYRYPSSFFIPNDSRAMFVKSAFNGLLPGRFDESEGSGWRSATWKTPEGMNDRNLEEPSHQVSLVIKPLIQGANSIMRIPRGFGFSIET